LAVEPLTTRDEARYWSRTAIFAYPPAFDTPLEFRKDVHVIIRE